MWILKIKIIYSQVFTSFIVSVTIWRNMKFNNNTPTRTSENVKFFILSYYYIWSPFNFRFHNILIKVLLLQKQTWLFITDNTNVRWLKIFHLYKGSFRQSTKYGLFIKGSARVVEPPRIEYKGFKYRYKIKGDICRSWITRTRRASKNLDMKHVTFNDNSGININKKTNVMSKYINGPIARSINRKKLILLFNKVI